MALPAAPTPGKMTAAGLGHHRRVLGHRPCHPQGLERPDHAGEIASLIIDNDDHGFLNNGEMILAHKIYQSGGHQSI